MSRFDKYLAIPFKDGGRDFDGCDCWGLCMLILVHEARIVVDDPGVSAGKDKRAVMAAVSNALAMGHWTKVSPPQMFDAVVMPAYHVDGREARRSLDLHIGCMIDGKTMIHTEEHCGPRVIAVDDPSIRIQFFARPAALMRTAA